MSTTYPDLAGLKALPLDELPRLAGQIRSFLVDDVCRTGGHLGPNLGVVELTIALHRVFDSPKDHVLFDTGHQTYVHKILTGRSADFATLRKDRGLAGYPQRSESVHDHVENPHASTALSYADRLAKANRLAGSDDRHVVAVIGDGAMTGGLAWEALNNLGSSQEPVVVGLNDNGRSYGPTVGGFARHLSRLRAGHRERNNLFQQMGLSCLGPVDGHDFAALEGALRQAVALRRPTVVHCVTEKGRGYQHAENDEVDRMHGIGVLDPISGRAMPSSARSWTAVFENEMAEVGSEREDVVCVTAAMLRPVGLGRFAERFPDRVFDVGIAEQHAVSSAVGLAMGGARPVVCLYATFLNRALDQALMDVALHRLPVTFVLDRAGITGPDGPSHHDVWDLALLGNVPGLRIAAPRDTARLAEQLREAVAVTDGPTAVHFPKAVADPPIPALRHMDRLDVLHRSSHQPLDVLIVAVGVTAAAALQAARLIEHQGHGVTVVDPRWVLPVTRLLEHLAARHRLVVTVEDGVRAGGIGTALAQACADAHVRPPVLNLGVPRAFVPHGDRDSILARCGLDAASIARTALGALSAPAACDPASARAAL
ncbi:1-deoxy-D-xylulose-5-phosphate synthase [Lentzea jiangxiensis]|uniref:1-deoxy-D-xylulose-5-phosphate synthase n=1 Tax=Lentzea jiangxiensis TaxID=641025 RepID=A0A1H0X845_9PSEU|nr:1-deoxy-D-xylulose-5-phosphate synthase [Lentzea jiangxiensis]SDP99052.1 1-deoxy-D-xylulose-5-phosphate synthase [Lentzea jiangxiensis]